jgi:RHS repeat-associated protein
MGKTATGTASASGKVFPGQYYDQETGLHYNYFRYYDPATGRYLTSDPITIAEHVLLSRNLNKPLELNPYVYVVNNPVKWIDRTGLLLGPPDDGEGGGGDTSCPLIDSILIARKHSLQVNLCIYNCNTSCPGSFENIKITVEWALIDQPACPPWYFPGISG